MNQSTRLAAVSPIVNTTIIEVVEQGQQGAIGVGVPDGGLTGQALVKKSNADYDTAWEEVNAPESVIPVRGGVAPPTFDGTIIYPIGSRVTELLKEYVNISETTGVFDPDAWVEVSTQNNTDRLNALEDAATGNVINEYAFTETTDSMWVVTNAGDTQADFDSPKIEVFLNGVKLRKGTEAVWASDVRISVPFTSIVNEDFLELRVTTTTSVAQDPTEQEFTTSASAGGTWTVSGIGATLDDFLDAKLQLYFNGVKLRKGTQAIWVSPTELQVNYTAVTSEDYLTIRNDP